MTRTAYNNARTLVQIRAQLRDWIERAEAQADGLRCVERLWPVLPPDLSIRGHGCVHVSNGVYKFTLTVGRSTSMTVPITTFGGADTREKMSECLELLVASKIGTLTPIQQRGTTPRKLWTLITALRQRQWDRTDLRVKGPRPDAYVPLWRALDRHLDDIERILAACFPGVTPRFPFKLRVTPGEFDYRRYGQYVYWPLCRLSDALTDVRRLDDFLASVFRHTANEAQTTVPAVAARQAAARDVVGLLRPFDPKWASVYAFSDANAVRAYRRRRRLSARAALPSEFVRLIVESYFIAEQ